MKFLCKYRNRKALNEYYRTVFSDSLNDAVRIAGKYTRKGYMLISVVQAV